VFQTLEFLSQQKEKALARKNPNGDDDGVDEPEEAELLLLDDIIEESDNIDLADDMHKVSSQQKGNTQLNKETVIYTRLFYVIGSFRYFQ
jgi:hypothetical protein